MFEFVLAITIGIIAGIFTGLIPGLHINLIAVIVFYLSSFLLNSFSEIILASFLVSMAITHTFIDFIPSIFLGVPNETTALSILPGHRMLLKGQGKQAIKLTLIGCFFGLILSLLLSPLLLLIFPLIYNLIDKIIPFILIMIVLLLVLKEETIKKKFLALTLFLFSGILGYIALNLTIINQPLLPLFTGLFGTSLLIISLVQKTKIPEQKILRLKLSKKPLIFSFILSTFSSILVSFFPGIGASQAATISSSIKKIPEKYFLIMLGAISSLVLVFSFIALYSINKPRTGIAVFIGKFIPNLNLNELYVLLIISLIVGCIAVFLTLLLSKIISKHIHKINYSFLSLIIILFLLILSTIFSGFASLLVILAGTCLGLICHFLGLKKIHLMGCLILPVIIWSFM